MDTVSKKLKLKLEEKNISAHTLEKLAGLKASVVHNILQGRSKNPTVNTLQAISRALDCPIDELLDETSAQKAPVKWNGILYCEAAQIANKLFINAQLDINKDQALNFIDEIYLYALQGNAQYIDQKFAEWLMNRMWKNPKNKNESVSA